MKLIRIMMFLLTVTSFTYSQSLYAGLNGGVKHLLGESYYSNPIGLAGSYPINGTIALSAGLNFSTEQNYGIDLVYIVKGTSFGINFQFNYSPMRGSGTWEISDDWDDPSSPRSTTEVETSMNFYSFGLGLSKWFFVGKLSPFLSAQFLINKMGEVNNYIESWDYEFFSHDYGTRYGVRFGGGSYYEIFESIYLTGQIYYEMNNLLGARNNEDKLNTVSILLGVSYKIL